MSVFEKKNKKKIDINVDTTSSTRNFGCISIRSGVTYLPKCTIPATSRRDSTGLPVNESVEFPLQFYFRILVVFITPVDDDAIIAHSFVAFTLIDRTKQISHKRILLFSIVYIFLSHKKRNIIVIYYIYILMFLSLKLVLSKEDTRVTSVYRCISVLSLHVGIP